MIEVGAALCFSTPTLKRREKRSDDRAREKMENEVVGGTRKHITSFVGDQSAYKQNRQQLLSLNGVNQ